MGNTTMRKKSQKDKESPANNKDTPAGFMKSIPRQFQDPYLYLSAAQSTICLRYKSLAPFAQHLPGWVPQREVAKALGYSEHGIRNAMKHLGGQPYVWATEFENVHAFWHFDEPILKIDGIKYKDSEAFYHAQKPKPFDAKVWDTQRLNVMRTAVRAKIQASPDMKDLLMSTYPHPLLSLKPDSFWGFDPTYGGENMLAKLLEEAREELKLEP
eukprot:CAMPEP_0194149106 /NCGR_PEP_ID=MMETSP0152-20130528/36289_1 /TAXON_ID=1049557 /ORGANISM="Thalassiothrix antarctica, Strain L6-D1" /LENGTH=212 /DNA_ID=CAMNT_0038851065 /DNA_START=1 /DNA_END=636 /DNA_ORIENTATION=+